MAFKHGVNSSFHIANAAGTLTNISTGMSDCGLDRTVKQAEVTGFSDANDLFVIGPKGQSFSLSGAYSTTVDDVLNGIVGGTSGSSFAYYPFSTSTDAPMRTGVGYVTAYSVRTAIGGAGTYTATVLVNGAVTSTTVV